jgi:glucarate dehydratase
LTSPTPTTHAVKGLRITKVRCTPVSVPLKDAYSFSVGKMAGTSKVIVEVETSEGIVGVGETFPNWVQYVLERYLTPRLVGENPFNLERITSKCLPTNANPSLPYIDVFYVLAFAGVEMALWDIMGKAVGAPSSLLMGGMYRTEIPFCDYVFVSGPKDSPGEYIENVAKYSKDLATRYKSPLVEMKVGVLEPRQDVELVRTVRQVLGDKVAIRVDANCSWTEPTAMQTVREFEKHDLANIEEPCGTLMADAKVRRSILTPVSAHTTKVSDVARAGLDSAVVNPLTIGGFAMTRKKVAIAESLGLDVWLHSRGELGFATAGYLHFVASNRSMVLPNQSLLRPTEHTLTKEGMPDFRNGFMPLPKGDGLGVTLDTQALDKYHGIFNDAGEFDWLSDTGRSPPFY